MHFNKIRAIALFCAVAAAIDIRDTDGAYASQYQIPDSLESLSRKSAGAIVLNRRIASVRPGSPIKVGFTLDRWDPPDGRELIAAAYSVKDGSLVRVLGKASALPPPDRGLQSSHSLAVHLPNGGLSTNNGMSVYKLALIAPHTGPAGEGSRFSAGTMLVCM